MPPPVYAVTRTPRDFRTSIREEVDTLISTIETMPIQDGDVVVPHSTMAPIRAFSRATEALRTWLDASGRSNVLVLVVPEAADLSLAALDPEAMAEAGWVRATDVADLITAARMLAARRAFAIDDHKDGRPVDTRALIDAGRKVVEAVARLDDVVVTSRRMAA